MLVKILFKRYMAIPSNIKWGTLWLLIGITGLVLVMTGHGIGVTIKSKLLPPDNTGYSNHSENSDLWGLINNEK